MDILFHIDGLNTPREAEGLTFSELFNMALEKNHQALEKLKAEFGNTIWTPEAEQFLSKNEQWWIQVAQSLKNPDKLGINFPSPFA